MDIQGKRKELTELVDNIKEHSDRLTVSHTLPSLELSVLLSKISKLYEEMIVLKHELSKVEFSNIEKLMVAEEEIPEDSVEIAKQAEAKRTENIEQHEEVITPEREVPTEKVEEVETKLPESNEVKKEPEIEEPIEIPAIEKLPNAAKEAVKTPTPYEIDFQDLNTKLSGKEDNSVVDQLQKQPISDLTTAIGLNERYLYSNELFGGNMEVFRSALKELNSKANLSEALAYFNEDLLVKNNWNIENELVHSLKLLVARRFK
jgi:hypothetical protein